MASDSYACLGGTEIINQCRVSAYVANGWGPERIEVTPCGCCGPELALALEEANGLYNNPGTDEAPWVSASEPESGDFAGFMVLSLSSLTPGPISREITQRANGRGSFLGPAFQASPTITVTGVLLGKTCCAVDYGRRWLSTVLQGSCGADCDGDDLEFLECCPEWCDDSPQFVSYPDCLAPYLRTMKGVQLVSGLQITDRFGACCGCCNGNQMLQVQYTLAASTPCIYRTPVEIAEGVVFDPAIPGEDCDIEWALVAAGETCPDAEVCVEPDDCLVDPGCAPPPKPPAAPPATNPCICDPFDTRRACIDIPAGTIPEFTEGLPVLTIRSGSTAMSQIRVRFWLNNQGLPVDDLDPCNTCGEVTLSRIPANSVFVFDAQTRMASIECPGSAKTDATPLMGSAGGTLPVAWPEIACAGARFTVCVEAAADTIAPDATIDLSVVPAECY